MTNSDKNSSSAKDWLECNGEGNVGRRKLSDMFFKEFVG